MIGPLENARHFARSISDRIDGTFRSAVVSFRQRGNAGLYAVDINASNGLFAQLNWCLYVFAHCEATRKTPFVHLSSPYYTTRPGDNWLAYFFEQPSVTSDHRAALEDGKVKIMHVRHVRELGLTRYAGDMHLARANYLLNRYLKTRTELGRYVDTFADTHFGGRDVLGVHFRGTDKSAEAPAVTAEACIAAIRALLDRHPTMRCLFVASDEQRMIDRIHTEFGDLQLVSHADTIRSTDGHPVHTRLLAEGGNYDKGRDALVNSLLLSRCTVLVRTASFLSGWASVFNPTLPVMMLNRPYPKALWFPDREVAAISMPVPLAGSSRVAPHSVGT